jgi:hypothetical protein
MRKAGDKSIRKTEASGRQKHHEDRSSRNETGACRKTGEWKELRSCREEPEKDMGDRNSREETG